MATDTAKADPPKGPQRPWFPPAVELLVKLYAIAGPMFYVLGRMYVGAFWGRLNLPSGLMTYSIHDYIYFGFIALLLPMLDLVDGVNTKMWEVALAGLCLAAVITIWLVVSRWLQPLFQWLGRRLQPKVETARKSRLLQDVAIGAAVGSFLTMVVLILILIMIFTILPLAFAQKSGHGEAEDLKTRIAAHPENFGKATVLGPTGALETILVVECTDAWCATYQDGHFQARPKERFERVIGAAANAP